MWAFNFAPCMWLCRSCIFQQVQNFSNAPLASTEFKFWNFYGSSHGCWCWAARWVELAKSTMAEWLLQGDMSLTRLLVTTVILHHFFTCLHKHWLLKQSILDHQVSLKVLWQYEFAKGVQGWRRFATKEEKGVERGREGELQDYLHQSHRLKWQGFQGRPLCHACLWPAEYLDLANLHLCVQMTQCIGRVLSFVLDNGAALNILIAIVGSIIHLNALLIRQPSFDLLTLRSNASSCLVAAPLKHLSSFSKQISMPQSCQALYAKWSWVPFLICSVPWETQNCLVFGTAVASCSTMIWGTSSRLQPCQSSVCSLDICQSKTHSAVTAT